MDVFEDLDIPGWDIPVNRDRICDGLTTMPALTHLCVSRDVPVDIVRRLLNECAPLQILVNMWADLAYNRDKAQEIAASRQRAGVTDVRFVLVLCDNYLKDWEVGARGGVDFWAAADAFVARKRRGEIEAASILIQEW
ncbi:hypothetical protein B0H16DRAFT_1716290 [Mycena metata]|uniref:Uncharacterized protein n=1 Tax=Mycena metata TaxID=1033252 RepID=A0AAD7NMZ5_9AGAR|nr:hypothetical protein B0H16DRAFT_1716290 [Mycena metata]